MTIAYGLWYESGAAYDAALRGALQARPKARVCDVGAGANPSFPIEYAQESGARITLLDISRVELDKAPAGFEAIVADVADPNLALTDSFDVVCSRMLAEHVRNATAFHANVRRLLRPGGVAVHYFPTLWTLPFIVNVVTPEPLARVILQVVRPRKDPWRQGKFPAYYRMCRGPSQRQLRRLDALGFDVLEYHAFFGHGYYERFPPLQALVERWSRMLVRRPVPWLTSYAVVVLRRR